MSGLISTLGKALEEMEGHGNLPVEMLALSEIFKRHGVKTATEKDKKNKSVKCNCEGCKGKNKFQIFRITTASQSPMDKRSREEIEKRLIYSLLCSLSYTIKHGTEEHGIVRSDLGSLVRIVPTMNGFGAENCDKLVLVDKDIFSSNDNNKYIVFGELIASVIHNRPLKAE